MKLLGLLQPLKTSSIRSCSYSVADLQNAIFDAEAERQRKLIGRIEKIEVSYEGKPQNAKLLMNKDLSTPHDVAMHISDWLARDGALAFVDGSPWDMRRPLTSNCTVKIMTLFDQDPYVANRAFWRTCSFLLGAVIKASFKDEIEVNLHSFPSPKVSSGSFVHDAHLSLESWKPTDAELRALSAELVRLCHAEIPLERLTVDGAIAGEIFRRNKFKAAHVEAISNASGGLVTLYRVKDHIDISKGPMISHTGLVGRASVTAVHKIDTDDGPLYRFQGVALPKGLNMNHFAFQIILDRASKLNRYEADISDKKEAALQ